MSDNNELKKLAVETLTIAKWLYIGILAFFGVCMFIAIVS